MKVGNHSRHGWESGNSGSKRFGRGSYMTVGGFARMGNEQCIGYLRLFLARCGSVISITSHHGDSPSRVVGDYC
jgi:hypothetical protein